MIEHHTAPDTVRLPVDDDHTHREPHDGELDLEFGSSPLLPFRDSLSFRFFKFRY